MRVCERMGFGKKCDRIGNSEVPMEDETKVRRARGHD